MIRLNPGHPRCGRRRDLLAGPHIPSRSRHVVCQPPPEIGGLAYVEELMVAAIEEVDPGHSRSECRSFCGARPRRSEGRSVRLGRACFHDWYSSSRPAQFGLYRRLWVRYLREILPSVAPDRQTSKPSVCPIGCAADVANGRQCMWRVRNVPCVQDGRIAGGHRTRALHSRSDVRSCPKRFARRLK